MARILTPIVLDLELAPQGYALRQGVELPDLPVSNVTLERHPHGRSHGHWSDRAGTLHSWRARLSLNADGKYSTSSSDRSVRTPTISPAKVRAWTAIELWFREESKVAGVVQRDRPTDGEPEGTAPFEATVRFRLYDGTDELYWNGSAWVAFASDDNDRNTAQEIQDNFAALPSSVRTLAVVAYLDTTEATLTPYFFGARVLFEARVLGGADDAVLRTVLQSLRSELTIRSTMKWNTTAETASVAVPPAETANEVDHFVEVAGAWNLTDDPNELAPLTGSWSSGTWTFDAAVPASKLVLLEYTHRPDVVWVRHRDGVKIRRYPSVVLLQDAPVQIQEPEAEVLVRDLYAAVPAAVSVSPPARTGADFEVRVIAEFWRDAEETGRRLSSWFGGSGYRVLVSPDTGQLVEARWLEELQNVSGTLAQGVVELRGSLRLSYAVARRDTTSARYLVRSGGVVTTTSSEKFP